MDLDFLSRYYSPEVAMVTTQLLPKPGGPSPEELGKEPSPCYFLKFSSSSSWKLLLLGMSISTSFLPHLREGSTFAD